MTLSDLPRTVKFTVCRNRRQLINESTGTVLSSCSTACCCCSDSASAFPPSVSVGSSIAVADCVTSPCFVTEPADALVAGGSTAVSDSLVDGSRPTSSLGWSAAAVSFVSSGAATIPNTNDDTLYIHVRRELYTPLRKNVFSSFSLYVWL